MIIAAAIGAGFAYIRTPPGRSRWDRLLLRLPIVGRIILLNELARCCRTISLLINVGLPMPEIMAMATQSSNNKAVTQALTEVQQELLRGQGLSGPMAKSPLFLPLMVEMVTVGEETGNLSNTLSTVAESYETESDDKTTAAVALLSPALTIIIATVVGVIAIAMVSAMYGIYSQLSF
jgi:type IV pilus assembly protein PilC